MAVKLSDCTEIIIAADFSAQGTTAEQKGRQGSYSLGRAAGNSLAGVRQCKEAEGQASSRRLQ